MNGFSRVCIIKGAAFFNDKIDGEMIDSGAVFIEEPLDESKRRARGVRTVEYKTPNSEIAKALCNVELPGQFEVQFELVTTKRGQVVSVTGFRAAPGMSKQPQPMPRAGSPALA